MNWIHFFCLGAMLAAVEPGFCADIPKAPVPVSPFIRVVYGYADAMLKNGRNKTGVFWSALDRHTLAPLTNRPAAPQGVREQDRVGGKDGPLVGSNPHHDENLLRLLSTLTELSAKPYYRAAADAELKWFLESHELGVPQSFRPWVLWDRCFALAPDASKQSALRLSQYPASAGALVSPRQAGFNIRALAVACAQTKDEQFVRATADLLDRSQTNRSPGFALSLAIDCDGAAQRLPESLASRLRVIAAAQDELFCSLPHEVRASGGFVIGGPKTSADPKPRDTRRWKAGEYGYTTAQVGMMCVSRYDNTGKVGYRDLLFAAAAAYLDSLPAGGDDAWPATLGHAITLELAAWRHSADWKYVERARQLGDFAVEKFWGTNALPRASLKADHYESITGADTLALALLELHLQILHITAVRCPANTLDR
jgi:hypothetical protein